MGDAGTATNTLADPPSTNPPPTDPPVTIDDADILSVEQAVDGLLNKVQADLGFPYSTDTNPAPPSTTLTYRFNAGIEVSLDTEWSLFAGLTLTNITLRAEVDKFKGTPAGLYVELSATATIGDFDFTVTGKIPRLSAQGPVSFILLVELEGALDSVNPTALVSDLTNGGYVFDSATANLDPSLGSQLEDENSGTSFATSALLVIQKPVNTSFFLQRVDINFASDLNWAIVPNQIELSHVSLGLVLEKTLAADPWNAMFDVNAVAFINDVSLEVAGQVSLGDASALSLSVSAGPRSGTAPEDALNQFIGAGTDAQVDSQFQLPPTAALPTDDQDPFEAALTLQKDSSGWYIQDANVRLFGQYEFWYPIDGIDISLEELYFEFIAQRPPPPANTNPSNVPLVYSAALGGSIMLANIPMQVVITYHSTTTTTVLTCNVDDDANLSLQDIAADSLLNPANNTTPRDLNQEATTNELPDSVPIDMTWCSSRVWGSQRLCILTFSASDLIQLQLKANFELDWQVTSQLTVTGMGIYFDITNPTSSINPSVIKGYAYGSVLIANAVNLFAFVAGVSQPSGLSQYVLGLTLSYNPDASLGVSPQSVISDSKFFGDVVATDLWTFPTSVPSAVDVSDAITSVNAQMTMKIQQTPDPVKSGDYLTSIVSMQASLAVAGQWTIFDTVTLEQLALNVVVVPGTAATNNKISYYAQLLGVVSPTQSAVGSTQYKVVLAAALLRNAIQQATTFTASISAYYVGQPNANVPISAFLQMPLIGVNPTDVTNDPSAQTVPSEISVQPSTLLASPVAQCSLMIQQTNNVWSLKELDASVSQASPWIIIPNKLAITNSTLNLKITDPKLSTRQIRFSASTTVTIGTLVALNASISVSRGVSGQEDSVTVIIQAANFQDICTQLVGSQVTIPADCPILTNNQFSATVTVVCKKLNPTDPGFTLASVSVEVSASNLTTWTLGPLSVTDLSLTASFDCTTTPSINTLSLFGRTLISGLTSPVDVLITLTNLQTLVILISTPIEPTQLVGTFVSGGLDAQSLQAPNITSSSGLDGYRSAPGINASITFIRDTSWYADNLSLSVASGTQQWSLVDSYLWAKDLNLAVALTNMHTQSQLSVILSINFWFALRPPQTGSDKVPCSLTATSKQLTGIVDTSKCNLAQFLYVGTAGFWNPPDFLAISLVKSLTLAMDWDDGTGNFTATCFDWNLSDTLPKLAAMLNPRLTVDLTKSGGGLRAAGQLAGTAMMLGVPIDLSYDLASGPFRIFGIEVKEAYKMAQRLYNLMKDLKDLAELAEEIAGVMGELAEFAGVLEIAGDIFAGLTALGAAKDIVENALDKVFGNSGNHSSGGTSSNQDDPSSNGGNNGDNNEGGNGGAQQPPTLPSLVVGGTLMSPGPGGESVNFVVYPKDQHQSFLQPFDTSQLRLYVILPDGTSENVAITWSPILFGVQTTFPRPSQAMPMAVKYLGLTPPLEVDFQNTIQTQPSIFSLENSDVTYPQSIGCLSQGLVKLTPKDQYGQPRLGVGAVPPLTITFRNQGTGPAPSYDASKGFSVRNDCLLLPFSLTATGVYGLIIDVLSDTQGQSRTFLITAINTLSPYQCKAQGPGLCSGSPGEQVALYIYLKDQNGNPYTPGPNENPNITIVLSLPDPTVPNITIPFSITADILTSHYLRPAAGDYQILITINDVLLGDAPFNLLSTTATVTPSITNSTFSVWSVNQAHVQPSGLMALGDQLQGLITVYDNQSRRYYQPLTQDQFNVVWPASPSVFTPGAVVDNGDGTYTFSAACVGIDPNGGLTVSVSSTSNPQLSCVGSPLAITVSPIRQFSKIVAYGSGLEEGHDQTATVTFRGFDQYGVDWPVYLGTNCKLRLVQTGLAYTFASPTASSNTGWYQMPASGSDPILVLLNQIVGNGITHSSLKPQLFLVPFGNPPVTDPTQCFVVWRSLIQNDISSATLYAVDTNGKRRRQGGDFIQTVSLPNTPMILTTSIKDNLDGSYTIGMMMPAAAFVSQSPAPMLQISVNGQPIQATPFSFPMSPLPMISTKLDGPGLTSAKTGQQATFTISCLSSDGQLSSAGFYNASAYLVQSDSDTPKYITCNTSSMNSGTVEVTYNVPSDMGAGSYQCYVFVNSEQITQSPTTVNVTTDTTAGLDQAAYGIGSYTIASPPEQWNITANTTLWTIDNSNPSITTLTTQTGTALQATDPVTFALNLQAIDDWFQGGGFMFTFDITIDSRAPIKVFPLSQPKNPIMTWINALPDDNGNIDNTQSTIKWEINGVAITVPRPERLHITPTDAATICYHYMVSEDQSQYLLYVFQAGQFVTQDSWPRTSDPASLPTLGLGIQRYSIDGCTIGISNVTTVPTAFRAIPQQTATADSFQVGFEPAKAIDGDASTFWHSEWNPVLVPLPHSIVIDLHAEYPVNGLEYIPRQDFYLGPGLGVNGRVGQYSIQTSLDGQDWDAPCATGSFVDDSSTKTVNFPSTITRFLQLTATTEAGNRGQWTSAAEITIFYAPMSGADIVFSQPWSLNYVFTPSSTGAYLNRGMLIYGNNASPTTCTMTQNAVSQYGCSVAVYSFKATNIYQFNSTSSTGSPQIPGMYFQGPYWNPQSGRWVNWSSTSIEDIGASNLKADPNAVNTVMVVAGQSCVTIFSNGVFQFSATTASGGQPISSLSPAQILSWWTDVTWLNLRVNPPIKKWSA